MSGFDDDAAAIEPTKADLSALSPFAVAGIRIGTLGPRRPGEQRTPAFGRGLEFAESRPYRTGDDPRHIDWRQTARRNQPFTRIYQEERERALWLVVDRNPSMQFGSRHCFKSVTAARAAAWLAWSCVAGGDRIGILTGAQLKTPRRRKAGVAQVIHALADSEPSDASLSTVLKRLGRSLRKGDSVIVLSDFYSLDRPLLDKTLTPLAAACSLALVQVYDVLEAEPPPPGDYPVAGPSGTIWLDTRMDSVRQAWTSAFDARCRLIDDWVRHAGVSRLLLATDAPLVDTLRAAFAAPVQRRLAW